MEEAKVYTHLVPVGFTSDKLVASLRQFPVHKIVILMHKGDENNKFVKATINDIFQAFKGFEIQDTFVDRENVLDSSLQILSIIEEEIRQGSIVKINIAGGLRNIGIAAYIASIVSDISIYSDIPKPIEDGRYSLKGILDIPRFPIKELAKEQQSILKEIRDGVESVDVLISRLKPELEKGTTEFGNERSRLSHHIKKLRKAGFIETEKFSKNLSIRKSMLGEIYVKGNSIRIMSGRKP